MKRRRIIDAVTEEADDVAASLKGADDAVFLTWRNPREHVTILDHVAKRRVAHSIEVLAQYDLLGANADSRADVARHQLIVTRKHLYADTIAAHCCDGIGSGGQRRIDEGKKSSQHHLALIIDLKSVRAIDLAVGHG